MHEDMIERFNAGKNSNSAAEDRNNDDSDVDTNGQTTHSTSLESQVEARGPDERKKVTCHIAYKSAEKGEVRNQNAHCNGDKNQKYSKHNGPHFEAAADAVEMETGRKKSIVVKKMLLKRLNDCEKGQRVGEKTLNGQTNVDEDFEPVGLYVLSDHFSCHHAEGHESYVAEKELEEDRERVGEKEHKVELVFLLHVVL